MSSSADKQQALYRINHVSWWKEELPSDEEYKAARQSLKVCNWKVDWIISHCCPSTIADIIGGGMYQHDSLTDFFEEVKGRCEFDYRFFGHYHDNRSIMRKYVLLYEQLLQIHPLD